MLNLKYSYFLRLFIGAVSLLAITAVLADVRVVVDFDTPVLRDTVKEINLNVYDSSDAVIPLASQSYRMDDLRLSNGEEFTELSTLEVVFSNLDTRLPMSDYWVEPEVDGIAVGDRQVLSTVAPNMNVYGSIKSETGGFIFPDESTQSTAFTGEVDPTVDSTVKDGVSWLEISDRPTGLDDGDDVGIIAETDPQVGANVTNHVPKWNGSALVQGTIYDNGNIGIGNGTFIPQGKLHVSGGPIALDNADLGITWEISAANGFAIRDMDDASPALRIGGSPAKKVLVDLLEVSNQVSIGTVTPDPAMALHVNGFSEFDIGSGKLIITTPGGRPGVIGFSNLGNRRDIVFHDDFLALNVSESDAIPALNSGITITNDGNVGIGTNTPTVKLAVNGWTKTSVLEITGGMDLSERFNITDHEREILPGMVLSINPEQAGELQLSQEPYDKRVAGVISGAGGVNPGMLMGQSDSPIDGHVPVALTGRVYVWADAGNASIIPGDLLTTSTVPGHAMKVQSSKQAQGAILGKAMTELRDGRGLVLVLVSLQ